ncbi:MAG: DUF6232 family protein [Pseudomonadota bacterium]|nr:DUF6232 family protein [Pseudomonadota bacterium]
MSETIVFEENNVKVTNARFVVNDQTYAMNGVTSVKRFEKKPPRIVPIVIAVGSLVAMSASVIVGLIILAAAIGIWKIQKAQYSVVLSTSSGEAQALTSPDRPYIERVIAALNNAIITRG